MENIKDLKMLLYNLNSFYAGLLDYSNILGYCPDFKKLKGNEEGFLSNDIT